MQDDRLRGSNLGCCLYGASYTLLIIVPLFAVKGGQKTVQ